MTKKPTPPRGALRSRGNDDGAAVMSVDPPWQHDDQLGTRGAQAKYSTMSTEEICQLELPPLAKRNVLFLWKLASMTPDAVDRSAQLVPLPVLTCVPVPLPSDRRMPI